MGASCCIIYPTRSTKCSEHVVFTVRSQDAADALFQQHATFPYRA